MHLPVSTRVAAHDFWDGARGLHKDPLKLQGMKPIWLRDPDYPDFEQGDIKSTVMYLPLL